MLKNGSISLTYASLMSLQVGISQQDVDYIKPLDPGFHEYWLHDEVIDSYLEWLSLRHTSILVCTSGTFLSLANLATLELLWQNEDLTEKELILAPYNIDNSHWVLVVVNLNKKEILYIDPMQTSTAITDTYFKNAVGFMSKILQEKFSLDVTDFKNLSPLHKIQQDLYNCCVYVCFFAKNITQENSIESGLDEIMFRKHIFAAITGNCLTSLNKSGLDDICTTCAEPLVINSVNPVNCKRCGQLLHKSCANPKLSNASSNYFYC